MRILGFLIVASAVLLFGCGNNTKDNGNRDNKDSVVLTGSLKISGSQTLYPMMTHWGTQYAKEQPAVKIDVRSMHSEVAIKELLEGKVDIAMLSRKPGTDSAEAGLWYAAVAMDAVVPIISFDNPEIQPLVMRGVSKEKLAAVFSGKTKTWGQLTGRDSKEPIKVYVMSDSSGTATTWNSFLGNDNKQFKAAHLQTATEMLSHVAAEKGAIGYCSIMDAYNLQTGFRKEGLYIVPIDFNGNGVIEDNEQFYDKFSLISNAVVTGKLASPPARSLYIVTKTKPSAALMKAFIEWVLTIGQNYTPNLGYINITPQQAKQSIESMK
jgi:phosphate transport system substrate-binding protein